MTTPPSRISAILPTMIDGALVLPEGMVGKIEASAIRRPSCRAPAAGRRPPRWARGPCGRCRSGDRRLGRCCGCSRGCRRPVDLRPRRSPRRAGVRRLGPDDAADHAETFRHGAWSMGRPEVEADRRLLPSGSAERMWIESARGPQRRPTPSSTGSPAACALGSLIVSRARCASARRASPARAACAGRRAAAPRAGSISRRRVARYFIIWVTAPYAARHVVVGDSSGPSPATRCGR